MMQYFFAELVGTMILIVLGDGVVANVVLAKTKGNNSGWIVIATGWGLAVAIAMAEPLIESGSPVVGAAWTAVVAITVTLALSLMLLFLAGRRLDRGSWILLGAPVLLAGPDWLLLLGVTVLLAITAASVPEDAAPWARQHRVFSCISKIVEPIICRLLP